MIATASRDRTARLWSVPSPMPGTAGRIHEEMTVLTGMELGTDDVVRLLDVAGVEAKARCLEEQRSREVAARRFEQISGADD